jgi:hypothetical protein
MGTEKRFEGIGHKITSQLADRLKELGLDGVLASVGLQRLARGGMTLPIVASFAAGVAVGASAGLLFAPMTGEDLRGRLVRLAARLTPSRTAEGDAPQPPQEEADAAAMDQPKGSKGNGQSRSRGHVEPGVPT